MLLPVDVQGVIERALLAQRRPPDGLLHPSGDLVGSLRHSMLTAAGAPTIDTTIAREMPLLIGTLTHEWVGHALQSEGIPFMREVKLEPWLPEGWAGTADYLFYDPSQEAWVLADLKTQKGEGQRFTRDKGAKLEHLWQVSAYWWALVEMGLPMVNGFGVIYLPKNDTTDKNEKVELIVAECTPLPREVVWDEMEFRWEATQTYLNELSLEGGARGHRAIADFEPDMFLNDHLAPVQDRVQAMYWQSKTSSWDVKLVPHWSADYCPFPDELCDCRQQGTTKIGHWRFHETDHHPEWANELIYVPRKGYEEFEPELKPDAKEVKKRAGKQTEDPARSTTEGE